MHSVEGVDHVGAFLREARETTGRTVADVAQNLRIRRVYLEAIEDGRFDELPGATYAVGFVRSYAAYLRLDAPTLVARFKEEASGIQAPQELEFPTPVPEGRFPGGLLVAVCLLVGAAAFGGWYWYQSQNGIEVVRVPAPPGDEQASPETTVPTPSMPTAETRAAVAETSVPVPEPPQAEPPAVTAAGPIISNPDDSAPVADEPEVPLVPPSYLQPQQDPLASMTDTPTLSEESADAALVAGDTMANQGPPVTAPMVAVPEDSTPADDASAPETPAAAPTTGGEVAVVTPAPSEFSSEPAIIALPEIEETQDSVVDVPSNREGRTYGARNAAARIILRAAENTWVQIRDADESVVLTQMLQAGDRYLVPNRDGMRLMTGNAGDLDISVDGESVPAIGERGESRRDVRLDPDLLKTGSAVVR